MRIVRTLLATTVMLAASCSGFRYTEPVILRHPQTGQTARCGPYFRGGLDGQMTALGHEARCISDYQRQGYERVAE